MRLASTARRSLGHGGSAYDLDVHEKLWLRTLERYDPYDAALPDDVVHDKTLAYSGRWFLIDNAGGLESLSRVSRNGSHRHGYLNTDRLSGIVERPDRDVVLYAGGAQRHT